MSRRNYSKQIIGQSLISPISAPSRQRQTAWSPPEVKVEETTDKISENTPMTPESIEIHFDNLTITPVASPLFSEWEPMTLPVESLVKILPFLGQKHLSRLLTVSKLWFSTILPILYSHLTFNRFSGIPLVHLVQVLTATNVKLDRPLSTCYTREIQSLVFQGIVFGEPDDKLLNWKQVKNLISTCSPYVTSLSLEFDDTTFMSLPNDYEWLESDIHFPLLTSLQISSRNAQIPDNIAIEFLRKCEPQSLTQVSIHHCLQTFSGTAWFLLHDRISPYLKTLCLTPCLKSKGWDAELFEKGVAHIVKTSAFLEKIDFSGHRFGLLDKSLYILLELNASLRNLTLPCGLNDTHLIALMSCSNLSHLKKLDISCKCAIGRFTEIKEDGWPCSRFTDSVLIALMEKFMADNKGMRKVLTFNKKGYEKLSLILPRYIIHVKTGKKIPTLQWAAQFRGFVSDYKEKDAIFYRGFWIYAPGSRLIL